MTDEQRYSSYVEWCKSVGVATTLSFEDWSRQDNSAPIAKEEVAGGRGHVGSPESWYNGAPRFSGR